LLRITFPRDTCLANSHQAFPKSTDALSLVQRLQAVSCQCRAAEYMLNGRHRNAAWLPSELLGFQDSV